MVKNIKRLTSFLIVVTLMYSFTHWALTEVNTQSSFAFWKEINRGISDSMVRTLIVDSRNANILYAGTQKSGIFKTTDGGVNWVPINNGLTYLDIRSIVLDPTNSNILYAAVYGAGVFKSTNGGNSWSATGPGIPSNFCINPLIIDPLNPNILYTGHYT